VLVDNRPANVVQLLPQDLPDQTISDAATWGQKAGQRLRRPKGHQGPPVPLPPIATPELRRRYARLGKVLGMRVTTIHRRVVEQLAQLPYSAVTVRQDAPNSVLAYIKERQEQFPGVDVQRVFVRDYPNGSVAAQLLGYVGQIDVKELKLRRNKGVKQGTMIGKAGLEYTYDRYLRGEDGAQLLRVDANGRFANSAIRRREPIPGRQLRLSIDLGLQKYGQKAFGEIGGGLPGAFVAMNPRNGQIYAMGSYPSFDPSIFAKPISRAKFASITSEANGAPLINRAIAGRYPSGSTFKPITALAGLDRGVITPFTTVSDSGCIKVGNLDKCNAKKTAYGTVSLKRAIQVSSDVYFYRVGMDLFSVGGQALQKWAKKMGLGRKSGIDLPDEQSGLIPGSKWRAKINASEKKCRAQPQQKGRPCYVLEMRPYNLGDNANLAVGQGEVAISPLQMATAYSALVTGGRVPRPHLGLEVQDATGRLVQNIDPGTARRVKIDPGARQVIMDGLAAAAREQGGTSQPVFAGWPMSRYPVFGKTGTAQVPLNGGYVDQSWYVAYVPNGAKPIVIAATFERGGFGADRAAPFVRRMLAQWFNLPPKLGRPSVPGAKVTHD
jgi:penicillin-binding protein 2